MKRLCFLLLVMLSVISGSYLRGQSNNALSIYEGERIQSVAFRFSALPADAPAGADWEQQVRDAFPVPLYSHFNEFRIGYYLSRIKNLPFVRDATLSVGIPGDGGVALLVSVEWEREETTTVKRMNIFKDIRDFPAIYSDDRSYLTTRFSASEMAYSNNNAWFASPEPLLTGNPLVDGPAGKGYTGWLEGFVMGGLYGITRLSSWQNLHLYGGASYIVSFSAGRELFTDKSRFHGEVEDAFAGIVGGKRIDSEHDYAYNFLYGRKQFVLGNGWLIINTSMNGEERAALQLNPRWAARSLLQTGFRYNKLLFQYFRLKPNELPLFYSHTILNGVNLEWGNNARVQLGASFLNVPRSEVHYYMPDGTVHERKGLRVYNLRLYGNPPSGQSGLFYKTEVGYQTNANFPMRAYAGYAQLGWNFAKTRGKPALSYRFAYFSGDNPDTETYERWDALYTGGTGDQWVQGSNMYKIVQNSNEMTHLLQLVYAPVPKIQTVTQLWSFIAPQTNNLGGNPGLSVMKSHYYGTELNLTVKYFHSRRWYFHLNTALTFPGDAVKDIIPDTKSWFCLMAFVRYSL